MWHRCERWEEVVIRFGRAPDSWSDGGRPVCDKNKPRAFH